MGYHPKRAPVDPDDPDAQARCDYSGMLVNRSRLVKQMEFMGNGRLRWTGWYVDKDFADIPNAQLIHPALPPDPPPLLNPGPRPINRAGELTSWFIVQAASDNAFWDATPFLQVGTDVGGNPILFQWSTD